MPETQTCPSRMREAGPWEHKPDLDRWETDRWSADEEAVQAKHDLEDSMRLAQHNERNAQRGEPPITMEELHTKWFVRGRSNDLWFWSWGPPRTCSFCGGVYPEDALRLLSEGWENEHAKAYKGYLNPPGSSSRNQAFLASIRDKAREPGEGVPSVWSPTPPVKLYVWHFDESQLARLNSLVQTPR